MKFIFFCFFIVLGTATQAQSKDTVRVMYEPCEEASYPKLRTYLDEYLKKNGVPDTSYTGTIKVYVEFMVDTAGKISEPRIRRGFGPKFDQMALDMVRKMPNWNPRVCDEKPVRTRMVLPIIFTMK